MSSLFSLYARSGPEWLDIFPGRIWLFSKIKDSESQKAVTSTPLRLDSRSKGELQKRLCGETASWERGYNGHGSYHLLGPDQKLSMLQLNWVPCEVYTIPAVQMRWRYGLFIINTIRPTHNQHCSEKQSKDLVLVSMAPKPLCEIRLQCLN